MCSLVHCARMVFEIQKVTLSTSAISKQMKYGLETIRQIIYYTFAGETHEKTFNYLFADIDGF